MSTTNAPHLVVEIAEKTDKAATNVGAANSALNVISASEAFRKFNWLKNIPVTNSADNLRGMVVSARWRTAFQVSGKIGGVLERVGVVAGLAVNIFHSWHEIETIYSSSEPWDVKGAKLSTQVSSVALRTVGGIIPAGFNLLVMSLQGYCQLGSLMTGGFFQPQAYIDKLKSANSYVDTTFNKVTDGGIIYSFINVNITQRNHR